MKSCNTLTKYFAGDAACWVPGRQSRVKALRIFNAARFSLYDPFVVDGLLNAVIKLMALLSLVKCKKHSTVIFMKNQISYEKSLLLSAK
tara:strand:- start:130 stop:396 length:267 start_codon:yes stop_codon:yes gene_type:complete